MVMNFNTKNFFYCFFYGLYSWVTKLNNFSGIGHNNMVVLLVEI